MAYITINKEHFYHNLNTLSKKVGTIKQIAIVLKDNAYGHGLEIIAKLAHDFGIQHAVVKNIDEARRIEKLFGSVLILNDTPVPHDTFSFAINSLQTLQTLAHQAQIELKIDTGMHRNGIALEELEEAIGIIQAKNLNLVGVMTHYKNSDELSSELFWQQKNFRNALDWIKAHHSKPFGIHSQNSCATLRNHHFDEDLVRIGIAAYGYNELSSVFEAPKLKPVMSLYASRIASYTLPKGSRVGYGGEGFVEHSQRVSTYDIGYGNGWLRATKNMPLSNGLEILGRVSMDFVSINSDEQEVCLMHDAQKVAHYCDTISYEITTRLDEKIERKVI